MAKYNGHKNWVHWNVSLWLNNDEVLYRAMKAYIRGSATREKAAQRLLEEFQWMGVTHTPDGAKYSKSAIRAAMVGM